VKCAAALCRGSDVELRGLTDSVSSLSLRLPVRSLARSKSESMPLAVPVVVVLAAHPGRRRATGTASASASDSEPGPSIGVPRIDRRKSTRAKKYLPGRIFFRLLLQRGSGVDVKLGF
jgi:hypothetical protein